jgi:N-acetylgalactosamine-6-sulfatase
LLTNFAGDRVELYDIPNDPAESKDLSAEHPERVAAMRAQLEAWRATLPAEPPVHTLSRLR